MYMEQLYEVSERCQVNFIGYAFERSRYDFAIVYTENFCGKPLVICMQTGKSASLSYEDLGNLDYLQRTYNVTNREEAEELSQFLQQCMPFAVSGEEY